MNKHLLLMVLIITYINNSYSQVSNNYKIEINKELWKTEPITTDKTLTDKYLNNGNLCLHFQNDFENDSIEIKVNGKFFGKYILNTEWSTDLARIIEIPKFKDIRVVSISINGGKNAVFEIEKTNQITVNYFTNNILIIGYLRHVPSYDHY
jgi:hypothetical protein